MRVIILGTGTDVGKTYATAALARRLAARPRNSVLCLKPVETGINLSETGRPPDFSDAAQLSSASHNAAPPHQPLVAYPEPLAPYVAARHGGRAVDPGAIRHWLLEAEHAVPQGLAQSWTLVETAGGAFSPLARHTTNVDLAQALEPARWLLVAPNRLGVLHAVNAACLALRSVARAPDLVLLTRPTPPDRSSATNAEILRELGVAPAVVELRDPEPACFDAVISALLGP